MALFVSVFAYAWGKQVGRDNVSRELARELDLGERSSVEGFRTLARARKLDDVVLAVETSTLIDKARCRMAGEFQRSPAACTVWLSIDEDVDASEGAISALLSASRHDGFERVAVAAMQLRDPSRNTNGTGWNVEPDRVPLVKSTEGASVPFAIRRGGLALVVYPRASIDAMALAYAELDWEEGPHVNPGLFVQDVVKRRWRGEDMAFCDRAKLSGVPLVAIVHPGVSHAGIPNG